MIEAVVLPRETHLANRQRIVSGDSRTGAAALMPDSKGDRFCGIAQHSDYTPRPAPLARRARCDHESSLRPVMASSRARWCC